MKRALVAVLLAAACGGSSNDVSKINHVVVLYMENHSFDNLYGKFAGADGLNNAAATQTQVDANGQAYATLPPPMDTSKKPPVVDSRFPTLPNAPFDIDQYIANNQNPPDLVHRFYQEQQQIDGGKMDKFAVVSDAKGLSMAYYDTTQLPLAAEAKNYTLCDRFFHAAFGGSFLNHIWLIAAQSPVFPNAPSSITAQVDANGNMTTDGAVTPDGFAVNTLFTVNAPHPSTVPAANLVPNQTFPTIGDRLNDKNITWAWYSGGWNNALAGNADPTFQFHHQPFAFFANYADGTPGKAAHLKDETDLTAAIQAGNLPSVSFVKFVGVDNEHPGYTNVLISENHAEDLINSIRNSALWKDTAIIITYDEHGGFWDHVAPPKGDRWGPGSRVPTLVISPYAKKGFIDHTTYDTTSILAFIEHRFGLQSLTARDAAADPMLNAFDFSQKVQ